MGRFSRSKTPQDTIDLGLTFRRKLRKRDYFLFFLAIGGKMHMTCIGFVSDFLRFKIDDLKLDSWGKLKVFVFSVGFWAFSVGCLVVGKMHLKCIGFVTDFFGCQKCRLKLRSLR